MDSYSFFITVCLIITAGLCIHDFFADKAKKKQKNRQNTGYDIIRQ